MTMRRLPLALALISLAACAAPDPSFSPDASGAAAVIARATAAAWSTQADVTAQAAQAGLVGTQAAGAQSQSVQATQAEADGRIVALRLSVAQTQAAVELRELDARLLALTPTPTLRPTPAPTADAAAVTRTNNVRDGGMILSLLAGLVGVIGMGVLFGAAANRLEGAAKAERIKAEAEAAATRLKAEAEAESIRTQAQATAWRRSMMEVTSGSQIISQVAGGVQILSVPGAPTRTSSLLPSMKLVDVHGERDLCMVSDASRRMIEFLDVCIDLAGEDSQTVPAASEIGNNTMRQGAVNALKARRMVHTAKGNGGGTYLLPPHKTLGALRAALVEGVIEFTDEELPETTQTP
jgi:hypothetical protein